MGQADNRRTVATRKDLEDRIKSNGAEYRGDLNKEVTHLIAYNTAGQKYQYARSWGIHVVATEWLEQSAERGMALEERLYDPLIDPLERGQGAWIRKVETAQPRKRKREELVRTTSGRKLRRTASTKFDSQNDGMWTGIVSAEIRAEANRRSEWDDVDDSIVEIHLDSESQAEDARTTGRADSGSWTSILRPRTAQGMFVGRSFYLYGFGAKEVRSLLPSSIETLT